MSLDPILLLKQESKAFLITHLAPVWLARRFTIVVTM